MKTITTEQCFDCSAQVDLDDSRRHRDWHDEQQETIAEIDGEIESFHATLEELREEISALRETLSDLHTVYITNQQKGGGDENEQNNSGTQSR